MSTFHLADLLRHSRRNKEMKQGGDRRELWGSTGCPDFHTLKLWWKMPRSFGYRERFRIRWHFRHCALCKLRVLSGER